MLVTIDVSHTETSSLKEMADLNIHVIVVTLEVSHCDISSLKEFEV